MARPISAPHLLTLSIAALLSMAIPVRAADHAVTTPPIDYSVYREGAVQRIERRFGTWVMTCDEIRSLSRKFCSLRGLARAADGTIIASLAVSTDDGGRPTALVTLPFGTVLGSGTMVLKAGAKKPEARLDLRPGLCDGKGCEVVWRLAPDDIHTLSRGAPLKVTFAMIRGDTRSYLAALAPPRIAIEGALQTEGFADALQASLQ